MEVAEHIISLERSALDRWIRVEGRFAVLTFNLVNYGKPSGSAEETVLVRWNATEIYREIDGVWRIVHTHWSLPQPRLKGSGPE